MCNNVYIMLYSIYRYVNTWIIYFKSIKTFKKCGKKWSEQYKIISLVEALLQCNRYLITLLTNVSGKPQHLQIRELVGMRNISKSINIFTLNLSAICADGIKLVFWNMMESIKRNLTIFFSFEFDYPNN